MNTFSNLLTEEIKKAIAIGTSYNNVLKLLGCWLNKQNINLLKEFIKLYQISINFIDNKNNRNCQYCNKVFSYSGIKFHELYCYDNPNRLNNLKNITHKNSEIKRIAWNKGLTIETSNSLKLAYITFHNNLLNGKIMPAFKGKHHTEDTKQKIRESTLKYIERHKGGIRYNERSGSYIERLNKLKNWNLLYYDNGGEIHVNGYSLDGYDKDLNIAFEYDEPDHYIDVFNNILKERDLIRQDNIIKTLDCEFWRYNEKTNTLYRVH